MQQRNLTADPVGCGQKAVSVHYIGILCTGKTFGQYRLDQLLVFAFIPLLFMLISHLHYSVSSNYYFYIWITIYNVYYKLFFL